MGNAVKSICQTGVALMEFASFYLSSRTLAHGCQSRPVARRHTAGQGYLPPRWRCLPAAGLQPGLDRLVIAYCHAHRVGREDFGFLPTPGRYLARTIPEFRKFVFESPLAEAACHVMDSSQGNQAIRA